ncbi:hypothetical protein [Neoroseomonas oryzicola]|uniref:Peptidase C80 domain-containing protein n=1 Tax=Neoroseomonas oryzicola TaxID=535904 RepID=A0A9X9WMT7_9PROT|nr:hypothetical protein [Neoroseomonas oryzicola]MBR0661647.1 hypothetical protein [Neoroseomonas oryzicola]NKE16894.1 hypothetical protein [Neoroseomonas oryzicola]
MATYDRTIMLALRVSGRDDDITEAAHDILEKINKKVANPQNNHLYYYGLHPDGTARTAKASTPAKPLAVLTDLSRLCLVGHGDWQTQTIAGWRANQIAPWLLNDLGLCHVNTISLISCSVARDANTLDSVRLSSSIDSFASRFTAALPFEGVPVFARYFPVWVRPNGTKYQSALEEAPMPKSSKAKFYKSGGQVYRRIGTTKDGPVRYDEADI